MSKFVIECPNCGRYAEASTGFFARKKIDCSCGYTIDVRTDKLTSRPQAQKFQHAWLKDVCVSFFHSTNSAIPGVFGRLIAAPTGE